jgi:hypothetical protein
MENTSSGGFSAGPHFQDHQEVVGAILDDWSPHSPGLNPLGFSSISFAGKSPGDASHQSCRPTSFHRHGMGLVIVVEYIGKTCSFHRCSKPISKKI